MHVHRAPPSDVASELVNVVRELGDTVTSPEFAAGVRESLVEQAEFAGGVVRDVVSGEQLVKTVQFTAKLGKRVVTQLSEWWKG
jgi:hypothetical protein